MVERSHKPAAINAQSTPEETATVIADSEKVTLKLQTGMWKLMTSHLISSSITYDDDY